jgi:SAM-dependent methyltransferase
MYRCEKCRNAFVAPMPAPDFLAEYYSNYHVGRGPKGNYAQEEKMRAYHPAELQLVQKYTKGNPGRLLDLGCGKGYFLELCAKAGIDCMGLELSDTAARAAREELGLNVQAGSIHEAKGEIGTFDTVTMWGVIEHLPDPVEVLRSCWDVLKPGGLLIVNTGTGDDWFDRLLPGVNQWYNPPQHLFVFSAPGLAECFRQAGFQMVDQIPNYDRSAKRWIARFVRSAVTGALLRVVSTLGRLDSGEFALTKFPMGNHQVAVGRKPG